MKIHIASDFHEEFNHGWTYSPPQEAELNLIAGDVSSADRVYRVLKAQGYTSPTVFAPGNHEYYGREIGRARSDMIADFSKDRFIKFADVGIPGELHVQSGGERIVVLAATLWTDFDLYGTSEVSMAECSRGMNCFSSIKITDEKGKNVEIGPERIRLIHKYALLTLSEKLKRLNELDYKVVVMTHHAPSARSIHPRFFGSPINPGFVSNLDAFIEEHAPVLWVHGHVHSSRDYMIGKTRVVANPRGYSQRWGSGHISYENLDFNPDRKSVV